MLTDLKIPEEYYVLYTAREGYLIFAKDERYPCARFYWKDKEWNMEYAHSNIGHSTIGATESLESKQKVLDMCIAQVEEYKASLT